VVQQNQFCKNLATAILDLKFYSKGHILGNMPHFFFHDRTIISPGSGPPKFKMTEKREILNVRFFGCHLRYLPVSRDYPRASNLFSQLAMMARNRFDLDEITPPSSRIICELFPINTQIEQL
jgi:hypothetical protein